MDPARLRQRLLDFRNADGGWPYYAGRQSRLEATAWAVLALEATGSMDAIGDGLWTFLDSCRRVDGLFVDPAAPAANAAWNGLTLIALQRMADGEGRAQQLRTSLAGVKGIALQSDATIRQDNSLQAWPWVQGTFSWVEPTAYCTLALKQGGPAGRDAVVAARLAEADRLLIDRACRPAGWNYGNSAVLGQELHPYVPTTALALLALQDRREEPAVAAGLEWLVENAVTEASAMALGRTAVCLTIFGRPAEKALDGLMTLDARTGFLGNAHLTAVALYAASLPDHQGRSLRI